jgi:23S rRNA pseudouridine1911/1915/1917 synthase
MPILETLLDYICPQTGQKGCFYKIQPDESHESIRLDLFLTKILPDLSRARAQALIDTSCVTNNQAKKISASSKVKSANIYNIFVPEAITADPLPQDIQLNIIYEDADLIVIDKPIGLVMHPAPGNEDQTLVNALLHHCGESLSGIGGVKRPGIVHRLDKDTSGLVVIAKNDITHQDLTRQFSDRSIDRAYKALVWGIPHPLNGSVEGHIGRHPTNRKKMAVVKHNGRYALTHYKTLKTFSPFASLIECKLATGRTHQIRVHLASIGHPVIGDPVYGGLKFPKKFNNEMIQQEIENHKGQLLHAFRLGFIHPISKKHLVFESNNSNIFDFILDLFDNM